MDLSLRLLAVDDEPIICKGILELIEWERYGFKTMDYRTGSKQALEAARQHQYDLVITDIRMPEISGLELIGMMKEQELCDNFIIISGYAEFEYARTAIEYGVHDYLIKPVSCEKLTAIVEKITNYISGIGRNLQNQNAVIAKKDLQKIEQSTGEPGHAGMINYSNIHRKRLIEDILNYTHDNFDKDISLASISKVFYINPVYLGQQFINGVGMKFSEYLNIYRINKAVELLTADDCMVYEICKAIGYNDLNYFYRVFKKTTGQTPAEYRKNHFE